MLWPLLFTIFLLVVVALKYLRPRAKGCPQCGAAREGDHPLCIVCGWIYDSPADRDEDYGEHGEVETRP
ncbi:MAG: hypothetical protein FJY95_12835 [Candidatus Handelsmanbacteria bacterium]|nr:hypothetical protein [Candidatus Handelsmanbacteria bacterium]